jgi:hypothetical protein
LPVFHQNDPEFLATQVPRQIRGPQASLQYIGKVEQSPVAGLVANTIIDALEMVQVDDHQGHGVMLPQGTTFLAFEERVDPEAAGKTGEKAGLRHLQQPGFRALAADFVDVGENQYTQGKDNHIGQEDGQGDTHIQHRRDESGAATQE